MNIEFKTEEIKSPFELTTPVSEITFTGNPAETKEISTHTSNRYFLKPGTKGDVVDIYDTEMDVVHFAKKVSTTFEDCVKVAQVMEVLAPDTYAVPRVHNIIKHENDYWLVMEKIEGPNLREFIDSRDDLTAKHLLFIMHEIAEANQLLINKGYLHNDNASRNVMLDINHEFYPRLVDFDLALTIKEGATQPVNSETELNKLAVFSNTNESLAVSAFIEQFDSELQYSKNPKLKEELQEYFNVLKFNNKPQSFSELAAKIRDKFGVDEGVINNYRASLFLK